MAAQTTISQILRALRWDFLAIAVLAGLWLGYEAIEEPSFRPTTSETTSGSRPPDSAEGDVLLLLPDTPSAPAGKFEELDCSYQWFNSLWQEYGSFATALTRDLSPEILAGRSVVIVPYRVAESMPQNGIAALASFARDGGQLVLERPSQTWASLTGVSSGKKLRHAQKITSVEGLDVRGPMRKHLPNVPLAGLMSRAPAMEPFPAGPTLIEVDGQAGLTVQTVGKGRVYTFLFDFGCSVTALQQGRPVESMRFGLEGEKTVPASKRMTDERLAQNEVPYADLLERAIFQRLSEVRPLPRLWLYPGQHSGVLLMTHPVSNQMRAALGYADAARKAEAVTTLFVPADEFTREEAGIAESARAEIGLHWIRGVNRRPVARASGIGAIRPWMTELALTEQYSQVNLALPAETPLMAGRVEGSQFTNDWATTFSQLAAARLRLDSSLGPTTDEQFGYLFGTGFPFYPIDDRGLPLPLLELPYLLQGSGVSESRLAEFLGNSEAYFHQSVTISIPAETMRNDPSAGALIAFRESFRIAREKRHWVASVGEFIAFLSARRNSVVTSRWMAEERRLEISVNLVGVQAQTLEKGAFPGLAIPRTFEGSEITRIEVDGESVELRELVTTGPSHDQILELGVGRHEVVVEYAVPVVEPIEDEEEEDTP